MIQRIDISRVVSALFWNILLCYCYVFMRIIIVDDKWYVSLLSYRCWQIFLLVFVRMYEWFTKVYQHPQKLFMNVLYKTFWNFDNTVMRKCMVLCIICGKRWGHWRWSFFRAYNYCRRYKKDVCVATADYTLFSRFFFPFLFNAYNINIPIMNVCDCYVDYYTWNIVL